MEHLLALQNVGNIWVQVGFHERLHCLKDFLTKLLIMFYFMREIKTDACQYLDGAGALINMKNQVISSHSGDTFRHLLNIQVH